MRRLGLAAFAALLACSGRPQSSGDGQVASPSDAGAPAADGSTSSSGACPEPAPLALHTSARGDFVVALPHDAHTSELALPSPRSGEAAMLVDYPPSDVAGFVLSRATSLGSVDDDAQAALRRVTDAVAALDGLVIVRAAGYHAPSHEQHETHLGVLLDIVAPARRASDLRATLIAALLSRSPPQLASLPAAFGDVSARQTVRLSLSRRGPSVLLAGAVTPTARYDDAYRPNGVLVDDLTSMLAVARAGSHLARGACLTYQIWQPATDVLLVVDSSSLLAHRDEIGAHAATIALQAQQHDAVTRIAVVSAPRRGQAPVLCRGRFFGPSEAGAIRGCALDAARAPAAPPPRDPLEAAVRVLEALAPAPAPRWQREHHRLVDEPTRIRRGASVSMVLFTTRSSLTPRPPRTPSAPSRCADLSANRAAEQHALALASRVRAAHLATLTVVGGTCASRCAAAPARAALSLARRLGGWALDICDPVSVSQRIGVASLASAFAPIWGYLLSFPRLPIPASLAVRHDGQDLARSRVDGFDYRRSNNSLALTVARRHGDRFHAAYSYWTNGELAADGGSAARQ